MVLTALVKALHPKTTYIPPFFSKITVCGGLCPPTPAGASPQTPSNFKNNTILVKVMKKTTQTYPNSGIFNEKHAKERPKPNLIAV